jgi:hypothetical protein
LRAKGDGCALCESTWGDYFEEVEGTRWFFCCALCAKEFRLLCTRIREDTRWPTIDELALEGGRYGRMAVARYGAGTARYEVRFDVEGELSRFVRTALPAPSP